MPREPKIASSPRPDAKKYLAKAREFLDEARSASQQSRHDAAMLNAIHAAISAADAVSTALAGRRSADPDHQRAADLLEQVGGTSPELRTKARQLRSLLARKNAVAYESRRATAREASEAVDRSSRIVEWAAQTVERAGL